MAEAVVGLNALRLIITSYIYEVKGGSSRSSINTTVTAMKNMLNFVASLGCIHGQ